MSLLDPHQGWGGLELLEGPCCEDRECEVRELFQYPGETTDEMKARLRAKYGRTARAREMTCGS